MSPGEIVYVIDDDESVREAVTDLLESVHIEAFAFGSTEEFFQRGRPEGRCCCLVLDVHLPGTTGLQFQESLQRAGIEVPIVFITAHANVPNAIRAIRAGAIEFLTKPFQKDNLLSAVYRGLEADRASLQRQAQNADLHQRFSGLTGREIEIMDLVSQGLSNKEIACKLDVSEPTVKVHRGRVMQKMQANSLADLVRMSDRLKHNDNG